MAINRILNAEYKEGRLYINNVEATTAQINQLKDEVAILHNELFKKAKKANKTTTPITFTQIAPVDVITAEGHRIGWTFNYKETTYKVLKVNGQWRITDKDKLVGVAKQLPKSLRMTIEGQTLYLARPHKAEQKVFNTEYVLKTISR